MAVNTKTIKRRAKSIGNTKKITKAMEMISAVKMRRAVSKVLSSRSYANLAWEIMLDLSQRTSEDYQHPLLTKRVVKKMCVLLVLGNRGLAGGFNSRLLVEANNYIKKATQQGVLAELVIYGRQGRKIYNRFRHKVVAEFEKPDMTAKVEEVLPMARLILDDYTSGKYDKVVLAYTDYFSAIKQSPRLKQLLPLENRDEFLGEMSVSAGSAGQAEKAVEFSFEPDPAAVLDVLLPRLAEMQIYQAILESDASEHSARMAAMRNASDAAEDIIKELNSTYNKARQSIITQEISEIVGGAAALG